MRLLPALIALSLTAPALAQDTGDDWDLSTDASSRTTMASVDFGNVAIVLRCQSGGLDAVLTRLPATEAAQRDVQLKFADDNAARMTRWTVGIDRTVAVSESPARLARDLRQGGRLDVVLPGAGPEGQNIRYALDLPSQHAVLDQTLTACDKPLEDPRDAELEALGDTGLPGGLGWARPPRPEYPSRTRTYERGFAVVSCLSQPDGSLRACEIEAEHPRDGGFGTVTLTATRRARLSNTAQPGQPIPARMIQFRANFNMESEADALTRSATATRLPR